MNGISFLTYMRNITELVHEYLEAKRHIWNTYFRTKVTSLTECSPLDQYEEIDKLLFTALVIHQVSVAGQPETSLRVKAKEDLRILPLRISEPFKDNSRIWNKADYLKVEKDSSFEFIDFFDWMRYDFATFPYIRVKIDEHSKLPDLLGREALIENMNATIWLNS